MKKTKIVCSIGPASTDVDTMVQMVQAGMNVARVNFNHASIEERHSVINAVRETRKRTGANLAILWDIKGPNFRSGVFEGDKVNLVPGQTIRIVKDDVVGNYKRFSVNHPEVLSDLKIGQAVLLENAKMKLEVISVEEDGVTCKIISGGILGNHKSISVPGVKLNIPYISQSDREDIRFAAYNDGEFIAISFVSCKEDVLEVKELLHQFGRDDMQVICKIESELGVKNLESILHVSDGIMVARGDLGTEMASELLPVVQKEMIKKCRKYGKTCIVATEMLETMMESRRPKRAETSDIANAVFDGADCVMLSGETTIGKYPVETVDAMAKICEVTENYAKFHYVNNDEIKINTVTSAIADSVVESANNLNAKLICVATMTGKTAKLISNFKPDAPILALCPDERLCRSLAMGWGIYTRVIPNYNSTDEVLEASVIEAKKFMKLEKDDIIVLTGGFPTVGKNKTNLMKIEQIK